jgi:hypothetical protein
MLNFCGIVVAILKMETGRNFSMSGINSGRWNRTMMKLCGIVVAIFKMATGRNFRCQKSMRDIIIYPHMKCRWNRTMLNLCGIVAAILKMAAGRNFSMSAINSGHHYLPTYQILMISDNVEFLPPIFYAVFCHSHLENGRHFENAEWSSNGDLSLCQIVCLYHYSFRSYQH